MIPCDVINMRKGRLLLLTPVVLVAMLIYFDLLRVLPFYPHPGNPSERFGQDFRPRLAPQNGTSGWKSFQSATNLTLKETAPGGRPSTVEVLPHNSTALLSRARQMSRQHGVVLFTMINDAFLDFAASWCCNTAPMEQHQLHQRVLFLTTDRGTASRLTSHCPGVTVAVMDSPQFQGAMEYSKAGYVRLMVERTRIILQLLEAGVRLLLFEVDFVWMDNPLPVLLQRQGQGDILATRVSGQDVTCGCFLFLNPTPATLNFWRELTRMMDGLYEKIRTMKRSAVISEALNDQQFFSTLARKKYGGIRIVHLPSEDFPDGKWYSWSEKTRGESRPLVIHNNWIIGAETKRRRAKAFGHWFWDEGNSRCNSSALLLLHH